MKGFHIIRHDTNFDFWGHRFVAYAISLVVILGSIVFIALNGLNFGIDFTGGTLMEVRTQQAPDLAGMRKDLNELGVGEISMQEFGASNDILLRVPQQEGGDVEQKAAIEKVRATLDQSFAPVEYRRVEYVGPQVGGELKRDGLYAVIFAMLGISAYIWFRFEWQFGVAAMAALFHDIIGTVGLFSATGMTFDLTSLAAVLMVAGYSINDTVIIFDRIRETMRKYRKRPLIEIINRAINDTLSRTLSTSITTLLALIALALCGGEVIRGFVVSLIFGVLIGTHSSIFVAALLLVYMKVRPEKLTESAQAKTASP